MQALEKLHIEDTEYGERFWDFEKETDAESFDRLAKEVVGRVLSLPSLRQLSGKSRFFDVAMTSGLQHWRMCDYTSLRVSDWDRTHLLELKQWNKP